MHTEKKKGRQQKCIVLPNLFNLDSETTPEDLTGLIIGGRKLKNIHQVKITLKTQKENFKKFLW